MEISNNSNMSTETGDNYKEVNDYVLTKILGKGTYGIVYSGYKRDNPNKTFAIKRYFRNLHPNLCQMEISILSYMNKNISDDNILKLFDGLRINDEIFLVLSILEGKKFTDFYRDFSLIDIKRYMYNLLSCLENIHRIGIVHRDLKPDNFLYNPDTHKCLLIDFGLAEIELEDSIRLNILRRNKSCCEAIDSDLKNVLDIQRNGLKYRIGTRGFLAPESIFNANIQGKAVDIWAAGVIFLSFLIKRMPVFNMNKFVKIKDETIKELIPLIIVYGRNKIMEIAENFQSSLYVPDIFDRYTIANDYESMIERNDVDKDCLDLLRNMMELNPDKRITAEEAKKHKFFKDIL